MIGMLRAMRCRGLRALPAIALIGALTTIAAPRLDSASVVAADGSAAPTPTISSKNGTQETELGAVKGTTVAMPPGSSSKNHDGEIAADTVIEKSHAPTAGSVLKNGGGDAQAATSITSVAAALSAGGSVLTCGASGNMDWTTTSSSFGVIRQCTLSVPQDGWVFLSADGSMARSNGEYEAQFRIGIDSTSGDLNIDRWANVYNDGSDGTDKSIALSVLKQVTAGEHTFYFLGKRYGGTATVLVYDPTLTVVVPGARLFLPLVMRGL